MLKCSGFPRQGATTPAFGVKSIILQNFCRKLYENERNYTEGGVTGAPWFPGKRCKMVGSPAVKSVYCICVVSFYCGEYVINIWTVACLMSYASGYESSNTNGKGDSLLIPQELSSVTITDIYINAKTRGMISSYL